MRFIHTADVHLHPGYPERLETLKKVCGMAREQGCNALLIAGDLFDRDPAALELRSRVRELFDSCDFEVFIIAGNHDEACYVPGFDYGQRVKMAGGEMLEVWQTVSGIRILGLPFQRGRRAAQWLVDVIPEEKTPTILLTHTSFFHDKWLAICRKLEEHERDGEAGGNDFPLFERDLNGKCIAYVALGHWHQPTDPPLRIGETFVAYGGSPYPLAADEVGPRKVVLVELQDKEAKVGFLKVPGVPYRMVETFFVVPGGEKATLEKVEKFLQEQADPRAQVKVRVEGFLEWEEQLFRQELEQLCQRYSCVEPEFRATQFSESTAGLVKEFIQQLCKTQPEQLVNVLRNENPILGELARELLAEEIEELRLEALGMGLRAFQNRRRGR